MVVIDTEKVESIGLYKKPNRHSNRRKIDIEIYIVFN